MSDKYTQRDWDRTVGWGKVPKKYDKEYIKGSDPEYEFDNLVEYINRSVDRFFKRHNMESDNNERIHTQDDKSPRDNSNNN